MKKNTWEVGEAVKLDDYKRVADELNSVREAALHGLALLDRVLRRDHMSSKSRNKTCSAIKHLDKAIDRIDAIKFEFLIRMEEEHSPEDAERLFL